MMLVLQFSKKSIMTGWAFGKLMQLTHELEIDSTTRSRQVLVSVLVRNQTSVGLTSDQQGRKLFAFKSEIISDQHLHHV
jgi:hypothetical protein